MTQRDVEFRLILIEVALRNPVQGAGDVLGDKWNGSGKSLTVGFGAVTTSNVYPAFQSIFVEPARPDQALFCRRMIQFEIIMANYVYYERTGNQDGNGSLNKLIGGNTPGDVAMKNLVTVTKGVPKFLIPGDRVWFNYPAVAFAADDSGEQGHNAIYVGDKDGVAQFVTYGGVIQTADEIRTSMMGWESADIAAQKGRPVNPRRIRIEGEVAAENSPQVTRLSSGVDGHVKSLPAILVR